MSDSPHLPEPAPRAPEQFATNAGPANTAQWLPPQPPPAPRPLRALGAAVRWLVLANALVSAVTIAAHVFGLIAIDSFIANPVDLTALEAYDAASIWLTILSAAAILAAGICWAVWQYRAADSVPRSALRRSPGWHAGSWFIPVVSLWFPFENVKDLVRASRAAVGTGILGLWWGLWIAASVIGRIAAQAIPADTLEQITLSLSVAIVGEALTIAAAGLAWLIVARITNALRPAGGTAA